MCISPEDAEKLNVLVAARLARTVGLLEALSSAADHCDPEDAPLVLRNVCEALRREAERLER